MANTAIQLTTPGYILSANDDAIYNFEYFNNTYLITSAGSTGGRLSVGLSTSISPLPEVGDEIFITSNLYNGTYTIFSVIDAVTLDLNITYIGAPSFVGATLKTRTVHQFALYKGFKPAEKIFFPTAPDYEKVCDLIPLILNNPITLEDYISINVKGLLKNIFSIEPNTVANSVDWSMINVIRIECFDGDTYVDINGAGGYTINYSVVFNCGISQVDLLKKQAGFYLTPIDKPFIATQGVTFATYLDGTAAPIIHKFINGVKQ